MTNRCSTCSTPTVWSSGRLICANVNCTSGHDAGAAQLTTPTPEARPVTILSARACAALARRHVDQHPEGVTRIALVSWLCETGSDTERASRGVDLALARGWLERSSDKLISPTAMSRNALDAAGDRAHIQQPPSPGPSVSALPPAMGAQARVTQTETHRRPESCASEAAA